MRELAGEKATYVAFLLREAKSPEQRVVANWLREIYLKNPEEEHLPDFLQLQELYDWIAGTGENIFNYGLLEAEGIANGWGFDKHEATRWLAFNTVQEGKNTMSMSDLKRPARLTKSGREAYRVIRAFLKKNKMEYTGGSKAFVSPSAWAQRGERAGRCAVLIVVHDGGDLSTIFNLDHGDYRTYDRMEKALAKSGFWAESMNAWSTAIYESEFED